MRVAIHQPNFLPYLGFFRKMMQADVFVLYDDVQFTKEGFTNRNRIKTAQGIQWITVPVLTKGRAAQKILDVNIADDPRWHRKILGAIRQNYRKTHFFEMYYGDLEAVISSGPTRIVDLNTALLDWARSVLGITTPMVRSSSLPRTVAASTERLVAICRYLEADAYVCGRGGWNYQDESLFQEVGIDIEESGGPFAVYPQMWGDFAPNLSVIDALFNVGPGIVKLLANDGLD